MCRWLAGISAARAAAAVVWLALSPSAMSAEPLDQLLGRLGLVELRLHRLERTLQAETDGAKRLALARQLTDGYAEQLVAAAEDPERFAHWQACVEKLLAEVPGAKTPTLEVVLWQADYQRAEALFIRWLEEPTDKASLESAAQTLARIAPLLTNRRGELAAAADQTAESIEKLTAPAERAAAEQQMQKLQSVAARAGYFAGWSHYYLGVTKQNPAAARRDFAAAKEQFLIVLDIGDEKNYEGVEADGLALETIWRARAVIGLGLAELGLGRAGAAAKVFSWLDQAAVSPALRDQAPYWQVQGMLNAGLLDEAVKLVAAQVALDSGSPTPGKCSLAMAAIRGGVAAGERSESQRKQLIAEGLRGLARMRQFETLDKLIVRHGLEKLLGESQFTLAWLRGRRLYLAAEKSKSDDEFRSAAKLLGDTLKQPEAKASVADAGQVRYYLGWCEFRLNELPAAARTFHEAATALRSSASDLAAQAAWMQATCLVTLAAKDQTQITPAIAALQTFQQEFPASEQARRADLLVTRLRQSRSSPAEAIRELAAIKTSDPNYASAQYEICLLQHQLWSAAKSDSAKASPLAADVLKTADRFLAMADRTSDFERRLKAALVSSDILLAASPPEEARVKQLLASVAEAAAHVDPADSTALEYQYRRLQLAQRAGDAKSMHAAAESIARHGSGSPYELPALVIVARSADAAVQAAPANERAARQDEAAGIYRRLVSLLGDSPAALADNKNALAASSKLAQYDEDRGRWKEAAERLNRLVEAAPKDRRLLKRAGLAAWQAKQFAASLAHWRTLLAGVDGGSDDWLEAKYYQLACLRETDRPAAKKVYDQFKLLYPTVKSAAWQGKLAELEQQLR